MRVVSLLFVGICVQMACGQGSNCGAPDYLTGASFSISPLPRLGGWSLVTLKGTTPLYVTLKEWDIYINVNGALTYQYDVPISGSYGSNSNLTVTYNLTTAANAPTGFYSLRLLLQNSQDYYINCWIYNYYVSG